MSKFIIFCADGTWNGPGQDDNHDNEPDPTNVYKLFLCLNGKEDPTTKLLADEQEKRLQENDVDIQVAKYIHGVGDSRNPIHKMMGGLLGAGTIVRIVRGYTFISREYNPGDQIVIIGFSRGAYTARALAGLIVKQGLLAKRLTTDTKEAYKWGARVWYRCQKDSTQGTWWSKLLGGFANLPAFLTNSQVNPASDLVPVEKIKAVAVWDTVGAMGFPHYDGDNRADAFQFTDTKLSSKVEKGLHAVALDEQRADFTPTLWDKAANVEQTLFAGAHADVGGGYTTRNNESGLADIGLSWMIEKLKELSVCFGSADCPPIAPNPAGVAHKPWNHPPFNKGRKASRAFDGKGVLIHESIQKRIDLDVVIHEFGEAASPYRPKNLPK